MSLSFGVVLDWEVEEGVRSVTQAPPEEHCHCYKRIIPDLMYNLRNKHAALYVDLLKGQAELDPVLSSEHQGFMDRIHEKVHSQHIYHPIFFQKDVTIQISYYCTHAIPAASH